MKAIDVPKKKPVETGEAQWLINPDGWWPYCSRCGYEMNGPAPLARYHYCPGCGAPMTKKEKPEAVTLDRETVQLIHGLISASLKDFNALPASYYGDLVKGRLQQIGQILASADEK